MVGVPTQSAPGADDGAPEATLLSVVPRMTVALDERELRRLHGIATRIAAAEPELAATRAFGPRTRPGIFADRWLVIGDAREIALANCNEAPAYEHRLSLFARAGDLVAFSNEPNPDFLRYRTQFVGLGPVEALRPSGLPGNPLLPLADRCRLDAAVLARIVAVARQHGGLTIVPHIGMDSAWRLAGAVAQAGLDVRVMGPPPRLARRVNDKLWFARLVAAVLGRDAIPPTFSAYRPAVLARHARALAGKADRIVVKVPDSSGGLGNVSLLARDLVEASLAEIRDRVFGVLRKAGWYNAYPLLVGSWEAPALSSPSMQLWIPAPRDGPPVIEGVFEQMLEGREGVFVGSIPTELPAAWQQRLAGEAMRLATVLQLLGYFGRCSLDALLIGTDLDAARLRWIECNGRWGGVSIPMTLVNRLWRGAAPAQVVVVERCEERYVPRPFAEAVVALDALLLRAGVRDEGIILSSPAEIEAGRGVQLLGCAATVAVARELADRAVAILSGSSGVQDCGGQDSGVQDSGVRDSGLHDRLIG